MATHSSILAWRIHGQGSLAGYSPWGRKESDMTEQLTLSFTLFLTTLLNSPFSYIYKFHFIVVRGRILYYFSFFAFIEIFLQTHIWSILDNV